MIVAGFSAYSRVIDWQRFRDIADAVGAFLFVDMAHVAGLVAAIEAAEGAAIEAGATLIIVESMKMEIPVEAEAAGIVRKLLVAVGEQIAEGQAVAEIE